MDAWMNLAIRNMDKKGYTKEEIAKELNISTYEVDCILNMYV